MNYENSWVVGATKRLNNLQWRANIDSPSKSKRLKKQATYLIQKSLKTKGIILIENCELKEDFEKKNPERRVTIHRKCSWSEFHHFKEP